MFDTVPESEHYPVPGETPDAIPGEPVDDFGKALELMAAGDFDAARAALEAVLEKEGPSPVLLTALTACYDEVGDSERAGEFRSLAADLDPRPLTREEHEGGPAMTDEMERNLDPDKEDGAEEFDLDSALELDDSGDPADALKELEALLQGAGTSLEGDSDSPAAEDAGEEEAGPEAAAELEDEPEPEPEPEPEAAAELEDEPEPEPEPEAAAEFEDEPEPEPEPEAAAELEDEPEPEPEPEAAAEFEDEPEPEPEPEPVTEFADESGDAFSEEAGEPGTGVPEADETGEADGEPGGDKSDMWEKIMAQADSVDPGQYGGIEDLEALVTTSGDDPEAAEPLEVDSTSLLDDDRDDSTTEVVESLDIDSTDIAALDLDSGSTGTDRVEEADDSIVLGPVELSEDTIEEVSKGLEVDSGFDLDADTGLETDSALDLDTGLETDSALDLDAGLETDSALDLDAAAESEMEGADSTGVLEVDADEVGDVDEALQALEAELESAGDAADADEVEESPIETALDEIGAELDEGVGLADIEPALEEAAGGTDGDVDLSGVDESGDEPAEAAAAAGDESAGDGIESLPGSITIDNVDDSITAAIQAEILVGKGQLKEAVRFFEALQLWDPERESFKKRLEDLRQQLQTE